MPWVAAGLLGAWAESRATRRAPGAPSTCRGAGRELQWKVRAHDLGKETFLTYFDAYSSLLPFNWLKPTEHNYSLRILIP